VKVKEEEEDVSALKSAGAPLIAVEAHIETTEGEGVVGTVEVVEVIYDQEVHAEYEEFLSSAKKSRLNVKEKEIKRQTAGVGGLRNVGVEVLTEAKEVADAQAGDGEDAIGAEEAALTSSIEEAEAAPIVEEAPSAPIVGEQTPAVKVKAVPEVERAAEVGGEAADVVKDTFEDVKEACEE
jgi:hypothetical protein